MNLYEINTNLMFILSEMEAIALDDTKTEDEKEQLIDIVRLKYDALTDAKEDKALGLVRAFKNAHATEMAIAGEIKALTIRKNSHRSKANSIKKFLQYIITPGDVLEDATAKISWRKSESVWFDEMHILKLPESAIKTIVSVNKTELKSWLKENGGNEYCRLESNQNIQLK